MMAAFLVVIGLVACLTYEAYRRQIIAVRLQRVELLAEVITNGLKTIMLEGKQKDEFQRFIEGLAAKDLEVVRIFSDNGTVLSSTIPGEIGKKLDGVPVKINTASAEPYLYVRDIDGHKVYSTSVVLSNDWPCQRCHGKDDRIRAIVDLEVSQRRNDAFAESSAGMYLALVGAAASAFFIVLYLLGRYHIRRPLHQLESDLKNIADGDLSRHVSVNGSDEFTGISSSINRIAAELLATRESLMRYESREMSHMEKMASIGELAATVAHEIKNPLAGISGALQVMVEEIPDDSPRREICNEILTEIERLDRAVKDLIAYAKPQEINPVPTDLNAIVKSAVAAASGMAEKMHVTLDVQEGSLPDIIIDPEQMEKVVVAILLCQCALMPDGGHITVSTSVRAERNEAEVLCADSGPVMTEEKIRGIFKPSFSSKHAGTGLSLAVSRNIVENHGGRIKVEREFGIGNAFHIIIPIKR